MEELESMVEVKCVIQQKHHRAILGNKGRNVQELTSTLNVQIKFPDRRRNDEQPPSPEEAPANEEEENRNDIILISGKRESVEKAKNALLVCCILSF